MIGVRQPGGFFGGTDTAAWEAGFTSVTPLAYNLYAGAEAFEVARSVVKLVG